MPSANRRPAPKATEAAPLIIADTRRSTRSSTSAATRRRPTRYAGYDAEAEVSLPDPPSLPDGAAAPGDAKLVVADAGAAADKLPEPPPPAAGWRRWRPMPLLALFVCSAVAFGQEEEDEQEAPFYPVVVGEDDGPPVFSTVEVEYTHGKPVLDVNIEARAEGADGRERVLSITLCYGDVEDAYNAGWNRTQPCGNPDDAQYVDGIWDVTLSKIGIKVVKEHHEFDVHGLKDNLFFSLHHTPRNSSGEPTPIDHHHDIALRMAITPVSGLVKYQVIFGGLVMGFVYIMIIFELVHRTIAAMLGSFVALAVLSALNKRPSLEVIVGWVDYETVMLLFGMMVMVGILAETGVFEWAAVQAWKLSKGNNWRLVTLLIFITAGVSALLDNVTTVLLVVPVTIRMCNVIGLEPRPVLMALILFSNIGGTATAVGDPPNVLIVGKDWSEVCTDKGCEDDIGFTEFTLHMFIGIIFVSAVCYVQIMFMFRNVALQNPDTPEVAQAKREIKHWYSQERSFAQRSSLIESERISRLTLQRVGELEDIIEHAAATSKAAWAENVEAMERKSPIRNPELLRKCCIVIGATVVLFFLVSIPNVHLDLGWAACLGAITLLLWSEPHNLEELLEKVEWGTLLFFGALFILVESVEELGLIEAIGDSTSDLIRSVPDSSRQTVAMLVVLWVSAIVSAFIDNIPFTTVMIPVVAKLTEDEDLGLSLRPLVWALAFGACLGGNGTLIGASANIVAAGMAEQAGVPISFNYFFSFGFPVMLLSVTVATVYLVICHTVIGWDL